MTATRKKISLGYDAGDVTVEANGTRIEIHPDGSVLTFTDGNVPPNNFETRRTIMAKSGITSPANGRGHLTCEFEQLSRGKRDLAIASQREPKTVNLTDHVEAQETPRRRVLRQIFTDLKTGIRYPFQDLTSNHSLATLAASAFSLCTGQFLTAKVIERMREADTRVREADTRRNQIKQPAPSAADSTGPTYP